MQKKLFETIRIQDGRAIHLSYHNDRCNHSRKALFGAEDTIDLAEHLPNLPVKGLYRAKVIYDAKNIHTTYTLYRPKKIAQIRLFETDLNYPHKYLDRQTLDQALAQYPDCDEILFVRQGLLTDTTIANIALRQAGTWYTPTTPLLPGTARARLLDEGRITLRDIPASEIAQYDGLALMNAMIGFYEIDLSPTKIKPL